MIGTYDSTMPYGLTTQASAFLLVPSHIPYFLVYRSKCILSIEIKLPSLWASLCDLIDDEEY